MATRSGWSAGVWEWARVDSRVKARHAGGAIDHVLARDPAGMAELHHARPLVQSFVSSLYVMATLKDPAELDYLHLFSFGPLETHLSEPAVRDWLSPSASVSDSTRRPPVFTGRARAYVRRPGRTPIAASRHV